MASETEWKDLVVAQIPALRAFAWSLSRNGSDADDLVQETLIKAWRNHERFTPGTNLRAWLFTILRNTHYTALSRGRREVRDEDNHFANQMQSPPSQEWGVALGALRSALDLLAPEQKEAVILVGAAGLSYEEAAEICGCAVGTVKSRVNRARARLIKLLDFESESDGPQGISNTRPTAWRLSM